jgi:hypothetical protein
MGPVLHRLLKVFWFLDESAITTRFTAIAASFIEVAYGKCSLYLFVKMGNDSVNISQEQKYICDEHLPTKIHRPEKNNIQPDSRPNNPNTR